ncbi:hypothetical protein [Streptomyces sp. CS090A]|nr:hypothetical protein [Streptomyces sp. CS090A]
MSKRYAEESKLDAVALVCSLPHRNVTEVAPELGAARRGCAVG